MRDDFINYIDVDLKDLEVNGQVEVGRELQRALLRHESAMHDWIKLLN